MSNVDWGFIRTREGYELQGYVPKNEDGTVHLNSGVTVSSGVDLGSKNDAYFSGLDEPLKKKIRPFYGYKGAEAASVASNLVLSELEADSLLQYVKGKELDKLKSAWNSAGTGVDFDDLPKSQATVLASVGFQYGDLESRTPEFWKFATSGDWDSVKAELADFKDKYPTRRKAELTYLARGMESEAFAEDAGTAIAYNTVDEPEQPSTLTQKAIDFFISPAQSSEITPDIAYGEITPAETDFVSLLDDPDEEGVGLERQPFVPVPPEARFIAEYEQSEAAEDVTFTDAAKAAFALENTMSWLFSDMPDFEPDLNFTLTPEVLTVLTEDIPEDIHDFVEGATSLAHGMAMKERLMKSLKHQETVSQYGWGGVGLTAVAAFADPPAMAAAVASEGVLAPLIFGSKASRLARVIRGATGAAATNVAIESYLASQNQAKDPYDILYAGLAGLVLGGAVGGVLGRSGARSRDAEYYQALQKVVNDFQDAQASDAIKEIKARGAADELGIDPDKLDMPNPLDVDENVPNVVVENGAMVVDPDAPMTDILLSPVERFDMGGQLRSSDLPSVRTAGAAYAEDAVGFNKDGSVQKATADINKIILERSYLNSFMKTYRNAYTEWAKSKGVGSLRRYMNTNREEFGRLVGDAVERPDLPHHPAVLRAADTQAKVFNKILDDARVSGVKGFENIPDNLRYFTHLWDSWKFVDVAHSLGPDGNRLIAQLLSNAIVRETPEITEEVANKIGERMVNKLQRQDAGLDSGLSRIFSANQRDVLKDILIEEDILPEADAESLMKLFDKADEGKPARAKSRIKLDINTEMQLGDGRVLRVKDFMERDAEKVMTAYIGQMSGRIGFAKVGIKSDADHEAVKRTILREAQEKHGGGSQNKVARDLENLDVLYNMILGRGSPLVKEPGSRANRAARLVQDFNFVRLMGQVGFAQYSEIGNAVSIAGWRALISQIPELRKMLTRMPNMEIKDPIVRDLDSFFGLGSDRFLNQAINRHQVEDVLVSGKGDVVDKISYGLNPLRRAVADVSGLAPITLGLQRAAGRIAAQFLVEAAFKNKTLSVKRLRGLGLDEDMTNRVYEQLRKNATRVPSANFKKLKTRAINLADWDDVEARNAFGVAIARWSRRSIQENDIGNLNRYMTSTMGKLILQFRTFMIVSWSKQFQHGFSANDWRGWSGFMYSSMFAGLGYYTQTQVNSIGRENRDEYLEERLSSGEIAKQMFARSTWASFLPAIIDSGAAFLHDEPVFAYSRSTGLDQRFSLSSVPSVDLAFDAFDSATGAARAMQDDYQFSRGQGRALRSILPLQNVVGIKTALDLLVDDLPASAKVE